MEETGFWERVNALIKLKKTTQRVLSKELGFKERRIETLVSRELYPDATESVKIAQALCTSVEFLVTGKDGLSEGERELLRAYNRLNEDGKLAAIGAVKGLAGALGGADDNTASPQEGQKREPA
jgi:hypothetical protein